MKQNLKVPTQKCILYLKAQSKVSVNFYQLKAPYKIFKFLSWLFGQVEKQLDCKDKVNFIIGYISGSTT